MSSDYFRGLCLCVNAAAEEIRLGIAMWELGDASNVLYYKIGHALESASSVKIYGPLSSSWGYFTTTNTPVAWTLAAGNNVCDSASFVI